MNEKMALAPLRELQRLLENMDVAYRAGQGSTALERNPCGCQGTK